MFIAEVFNSIQGEGRYLGTPSAFIRTSGCNLRCWFCDTPYTSWQPEGDDWPIERLIQQMADWGTRHVVITGGEPMLMPEVVPLSIMLSDAGHLVTVETAGTVAASVTAHLMSISPKLSNSTPIGTDWQSRHDQRRHRPDVIRGLIRDYDYQLKFVVDRPEDLPEVDRWLAEFPEVDQRRVLLMPQGISAEALSLKLAWLAPLATARGWQVTRRLHVELHGNRRGV